MIAWIVGVLAFLLLALLGLAGSSVWVVWSCNRSEWLRHEESLSDLETSP